MARLGDVCEIVTGSTPKSGCPEYWNGDINWVTPAELTDDTDVIYETQRKITRQAVIDSSLKPFPCGTVLLSSRAPIGKVAIAGTEMYCNQGFKNLICSDKIYNRYLFHFLRSKTQYLNSLGRGATFKEISKSIVADIEIPLPTLEEQRKIAVVLDKISDLTAKRRRQLDKLDELVKSRFIEMFGDPEKNPYGWECTVLANLMSIKPQNGLYKPQTDYVQGNNGVPILRIDAFYNGKVKDFRALKRLMCSEKEIERYELHENDIVINRVNSVEYLGKCAHIKGLVERTVFESNMMRFHLNEAFINPVYAVYLLCTNYVYNQILSKAKKAVNQASINQNDVMSIKLLIPPVAQQKQFANFYITTDRLQSMIKRSFTALEMLKKSLMQEYFSLR